MARSPSAFPGVETPGYHRLSVRDTAGGGHDGIPGGETLGYWLQVPAGRTMMKASAALPFQRTCLCTGSSRPAPTAGVLEN